MIVFAGQVTFEVEKHIFRKTRKMLHIIFSIAWFILLIPIAIATIDNDMVLFLYGYLAMLPVLNLAVLIVQPNQKQRKIIPSRITIDERRIEYSSKHATVYRYVSNVKVVRDYGNYYDVIFKFGKASDFFVCQKDLLSCGTLKEFEKVFKGKLVRIKKA
jgi:hypothetical protein